MGDDHIAEDRANKKYVEEYWAYFLFAISMFWNSRITENDGYSTKLNPTILSP